MSRIVVDQVECVLINQMCCTEQTVRTGDIVQKSLVPRCPVALSHSRSNLVRTSQVNFRRNVVLTRQGKPTGRLWALLERTVQQKGSLLTHVVSFCDLVAFSTL